MGIKVANIIEEGRYGGPQARIIAIAKRLKDKGIEIVVILPKNNSGIFQKRLDQNTIRSMPIRLHRLTRDIRHLSGYFIFFISELLKLIRIIKTEKFDIINCNSSHQIKGALAAKLAGAKVVWHLEDTRSRPKIVKWLFLLLAPHVCDIFIPVGQRVEACYLSGSSLIKKPHFEIQAPVDTRFFDPALVDEDQIMARNGCLNIVTVGNVNPAKGFEFFIKMAQLLNAKYDDLQFFVIGNHFDSQKKYSNMLFSLLKRIKIENLFFKEGVIDVRPYLKAATIYVCSSIHEASPMSVWEAMSMAKPIVSTDVGDVSRFIINGKNGFIVPPLSSEDLAEKGEMLLRNEELRKHFSERARKTAVESLDIDICAKKHAQAYRFVLNHSMEKTGANTLGL